MAAKLDVVKCISRCTELEFSEGAQFLIAGFTPDY